MSGMFEAQCILGTRLRVGERSPRQGGLVWAAAANGREHAARGCAFEARVASTSLQKREQASFGKYISVSVAPIGIGLAALLPGRLCTPGMLASALSQARR